MSNFICDPKHAQILKLRTGEKLTLITLLKGEPGDLAAPPRKKKKIVVEAPAKEMKKVEEMPHKPQKDEDLTQDYEEWKRKILENAANAQKATAE